MNTKVIRKILIATMFLILPILISGCAASKNPLLGVWGRGQVEMKEGYKNKLSDYNVFEFSKDGKIKLGNKNDNKITWSEEKVKYTLVEKSAANLVIINDEPFEYSLKSPEMILKNDSIKIQLTKNKAK